MAESEMAAGVVKQMAKFGTCEISDALIKLKNPSGGHLSGIFSHAPQTKAIDLCGPAFTVEMISQSDTLASKPDKHFVDATEGHNGCVMVISAPHDTRSALWGGLMTIRAQINGVQGVILSGRCRDLQEQWDSGFPIYARSHSTLGQSPFTRPFRLQSTLEISDPSSISFPPTKVEPGDIIRADVDGVVVVPLSIAEKVMELALKGRQVDENCRKDLLAGRNVKETFAKWR